MWTIVYIIQDLCGLYRIFNVHTWKNRVTSSTSLWSLLPVWVLHNVQIITLLFTFWKAKTCSPPLNCFNPGGILLGVGVQDQTELAYCGPAICRKGLVLGLHIVISVVTPSWDGATMTEQRWSRETQILERWAEHFDAVLNRPEQNADLYTTFVDLTKAFQTVSCDGLWKIMRKFGCPDRFILMERQFHNGMQAHVFDDRESSAPFPVPMSRVKQGCVLGSTLFSWAWCFQQCLPMPSMTLTVTQAFCLFVSLLNV